MAVLKYKDPITGEYVSLGLGTIDVVDNLMSTSTTSALSANQGRILNEKKLEASNIIAGDNITLDKNGNDVTINASQINVVDNLTSTSATDALSANQGKYLNEKIGNWGNTEALDDYEGDLNDIVQTGFIMANSDTTNTPYTDCWYVLTFVKNPAYYLLQIAFLRNNPNVIYVRTKDDYTIWSAWSPIKQNITTGTEFETGRIIDGKKEYGKRVRLGNLPNNEKKDVAHGISNITFTKIEGICDDGLGNRLPLPYINIDSLGASISMYIDGANIRIKTYSDKSAYVGYATLYYTKN